MWAKEDGDSLLNDENINRLFTGQMYDKESGLYYMNARYYDPDIGTFMTADPAMSGLNHYAYASANPIRYTDPTGLEEAAYGGDPDRDEADYGYGSDLTDYAPQDNDTEYINGEPLTQAEIASRQADADSIFGPGWADGYIAEQNSYFRSGWFNEWDWAAVKAKAEHNLATRASLATKANVQNQSSVNVSGGKQNKPTNTNKNQATHSILTVGYNWTVVNGVWILHSYNIVRDPVTGAQYALRSGPSKGDGFYLDPGTIWARTGNWDKNFVDPPSTTVSYQFVGTVNKTFDEVKNLMIDYADKINGLQINYSYLELNSNTTTHGFLEILGYESFVPTDHNGNHIICPGWDNILF